MTETQILALVGIAGPALGSVIVYLMTMAFERQRLYIRAASRIAFTLERLRYTLDRWVRHSIPNPTANQNPYDVRVRDEAYQALDELKTALQ